MSDPAAKIISLVLSIQRRNGGTLAHLDQSLPLLAPELGLDSLDLAEIVACAQRESGISPFDSVQPPRTWAEFLQCCKSQA